ncbi:MAG: hypothetical protein QOE53_1931 [Pseudonocardiales bacterium]|nr:hypothetical protein [Pseudonocardiales bacterium]
MRTQPPGFRWLVGGFALVAAVAFGAHYRSAGDRADLILGALCLVAACYWLIFDREPGAEDQADGSGGCLAGADELAAGLGHVEEPGPDHRREDPR